MNDRLIELALNIHHFNQDVMELNIKYSEEIERLNNIINRIKSIYASLCFSAPENHYIFLEQLGEVLEEVKGSVNNEEKEN